jgi:hypothetical protein
MLLDEFVFTRVSTAKSGKPVEKAGGCSPHETPDGSSGRLVIIYYLCRFNKDFTSFPFS